MKILQICNKSPFPAVDGGTIAMGSMTRNMVMNRYDVTVLNMVSYKHQATEQDWPDELKQKVQLHFANVDLRLKPIRAFINLFSSRSYHAERFFSNEAAGKIAALLKSEPVDVVHMETVFPMVYHDIIRQHSRAKIILRLHNIEHEVWQSTAQAEHHALKKWYLALLAKRLKVFELDSLKKADAVITISSADHSKVRSYGIAAPLVNIPLGIELEKYPVQDFSANELPVLFHLGAMDWIPNQQGMTWFLNTAWRTLAAKYPRLQFYIAGRKMPERFLQMKNEQLHAEGAIENSLHFMQSKNIMIVPVLSGSGIRIKILEGMALGKTVVTTSLGAAGIDYSDGENILIGNSPEELVQKISGCIENPEQCERIGRNARKLVEEKYAIAITSSQLDAFLTKLR